MKVPKKLLFFILIMALGIFLRFFYLDQVPNGLYSDEAAYGYNAYSILKTGKDEFGVKMPLAFKSFGDFKAPLIFYVTVPFIWFFDLSIFGVRAGSAIAGSSLIFLVYMLTGLLFAQKKYALLAAWTTAVLPFGLQFSRMAHENNLSANLTVAGLILFLLGLKKKASFLLPAFFLFALSLYAYHDARVFMPFFILLLMVLFRRELWLKRKQLFAGCTIFLLTALPLVKLSQTEAFWARVKNVSIFSDPGIPYLTNFERSEVVLSGYFAPALFHNKFITYGKLLLENLTRHLTVDYLFLNGDPVQIFKTVGTGPLLVVFLPFLIFGIYALVRRTNSAAYLLAGWGFLSLLPAVLTRFTPSSHRTLTILPVLAVILTMGIIYFLKLLRSDRVRIPAVCVLVAALTFNIAYYLHMYYFVTPIRFAPEWHYGMDQVIAEVEKRQDQYQTVWFSKTAWGYIYPLFYLQYPPEKFQLKAKLSAPDEYGFGWIEGFDKYVFDYFPDQFEEMDNIMWVGTPHEFQKIVSPLAQIYYPDGNIAFYLADKNSYANEKK